MLALIGYFANIYIIYIIMSIWFGVNELFVKTFIGGLLALKFPN